MIRSLAIVMICALALLGGCAANDAADAPLGTPVIDISPEPEAETAATAEAPEAPESGAAEAAPSAEAQMPEPSPATDGRREQIVSAVLAYNKADAPEVVQLEAEFVEYLTGEEVNGFDLVYDGLLHTLTFAPDATVGFPKDGNYDDRESVTPQEFIARLTGFCANSCDYPMFTAQLDGDVILSMDYFYII